MNCTTISTRYLSFPARCGAVAATGKSIVPHRHTCLSVTLSTSSAPFSDCRKDINVSYINFFRSVALISTLNPRTSAKFYLSIHSISLTSRNSGPTLLIRLYQLHLNSQIAICGLSHLSDQSISKTRLIGRTDGDTLLGKQ